MIVANGIEVRTGAGAHHPIAEARFADAGVPGSMPIELMRDELVWVVDDPVTVGAETWYHVALHNRPYDDGRFLTGWIASGGGEDEWIERFDVSSGCPGPNANADDAIGGTRRLACFGSEPFSLIGEFASGDAECEERWLTCAAGYLIGDIGGRLPLYLDPAHDIDLPQPGARGQLVGRLEHPSSSDCALGAIDVEQATAAVLYCRSRVVVESVTSPPPPIGRVGEPAPVLEVVGVESIDSGRWNRYTLRVANAADYPIELFAAAPDLPGCGASPHSARAWVGIFDDSGAPIATYCALTDLEGLRSLSFNLPAGAPPPAVHVEINDRVEAVVYRSNTVRLEGH